MNELSFEVLFEAKFEKIKCAFRLAEFFLLLFFFFKKKNSRFRNTFFYDSFRASPSNSLADVKDKIWNQLNGSDYLEKVFLRSRQNYGNETRKIKKSDLRFKGVRAYSNELYEFRKDSKNTNNKRSRQLEKCQKIKKKPKMVKKAQK